MSCVSVCLALAKKDSPHDGQVHYVILWEVAVNFCFGAFLLKTGCFHFFVKLKMAAIFVFKMAGKTYI